MPTANDTLDNVHCNQFFERPPIVLTRIDHDYLVGLLRIAPATIDPVVARFLREELERADIVYGEIAPTVVVSIGSTVKFVDHDAMTLRRVKLVLPDEANDVDLISVTGARGTALIGLGPGQTISWHEGHAERATTVLETTAFGTNFCDAF